MKNWLFGLFRAKCVPNCIICPFIGNLNMYLTRCMINYGSGSGMLIGALLFRILQGHTKERDMKTKVIVIVMMILVASIQAEGQKRAKMMKVTGTVTDIEMHPVGGVLIVIDFQDSGIRTRSNGTYKIKVGPDVRSIGAYTSNMGSAVTVFEGQQKVDFVLDGTEAMVNFAPAGREGDPKVDIGYGTVKKKDVNTDVGYIDGQTVDNAAYSNIYDMIQGRVPGVEVVGNKITIRGPGSLHLSSDPLFVVDGVAVSSIDNINPREVKSISVLKGASAAIYGTRGANGVILITLIGSGR